MAKTAHHAVGPRGAAAARSGLHRPAAHKSGHGVRHDLEGLRALAVLGVVVYHLRPSWLPGGFAGVDVFFVLSGYFITGLLLREIDRTGTVDLLAFWSRRARRLLPASAVVIVATVVAACILTNPLEGHRVARDGLWSSEFGMNWLAAHQSTQYLADPDPSPLVHFWSLGVEEQFYVVWPVVLLALAALARSVRTVTTRGLLVPLSVVLCTASFSLALSQTVGANSYAYFGTLERAWQLALGGLLAVLGVRCAQLPQSLLVLARGAGVTLVVGFYVAVSTDLVYPGRKSLVPAIGAALVIAAGEPLWRCRDPLARILCSTPAQLGGRYSYSWYLWHYPPLVLLPILLGRPLRIRELGWCAVATFTLAVLTYHLLENPVRSNRWLVARRGRSLAFGALLVVLAAGSAQYALVKSSTQAKAVVHTAAGQRLIPTPAAAAAEEVQPSRDRCQVPLTSTALSAECRYLPDTGHGDVVLVGDSHAAMWYPAVRAVAQRHRWGLRVWARTACPFADVVKDGPDGDKYTACDRWHADILSRLVAAHPSLVIVANFDSNLSPLYSRVTGARLRTAAARLAFEQGMAKYLKVLRAADIHVLVIHDVPGFATSAPDCALAHPHHLAACSAPQAETLPGEPNDLQAARSVPGVHSMSFTATFCPAGMCHQIIGSTLAYRDQNHLTTEMVLRLTPQIDAAAVEAAGSS